MIVVWQRRKNWQKQYTRDTEENVDEDEKSHSDRTKWSALFLVFFRQFLWSLTLRMNEREREERTFALCAPAVINQPKCSTFEFCSPTKKGTILCGSAADDRIVRNCL